MVPSNHEVQQSPGFLTLPRLGLSGETGEDCIVLW